MSSNNLRNDELEFTPTFGTQQQNDQTKSDDKKEGT